MGDRQADLKENLRLLYDQLAGKEKALILAPAEEQVRLRQQIQNLKQEIGEFEAELQGLPSISDQSLTPEQRGQEGANRGVNQQSVNNVMNTAPGSQGLQVNAPQEHPIIQIQGNPTLNFGVQEKK